MSAPLLQFKQVDLHRDGKALLQGITFDVQPAEVVGIIGPNGAGKTALLQTVLKQLDISAGQILLQQKPLSAFSATQRAQQLAVVNQLNMPLFDLTVRQVVSLGLLPHKQWFEFSKPQDEQFIDTVLDSTGLLSKQAEVVNRLSGGEQQRVAIARALVQQPSLLLLDEPTNHLDIQYQHQVMKMIRQQGLSVLVCLHDLDLAARYCDRVLLLAEGRLQAFGTPQQVLQPALLESVFGLRCVVEQHQLTGRLHVIFLPD